MEPSRRAADILEEPLSGDEKIVGVKRLRLRLIAAEAAPTAAPTAGPTETKGWAVV